MTESISLKVNKHFILYISIFIITFSGSVFAVNAGMQRKLEYLGYGVFMLYILIHFIRTFSKKKMSLYTTAVIVAVLFSVGLLLQGLALLTKVNLLFTMYAIIFAALLSEGAVSSYEQIRRISYAIMLGVVVSAIATVATGVSIAGPTASSEGVLGFVFTFDGGILYKNYFGADVLAGFIGLFLNARYGEKKHPIDYPVMLACLIFVFLSGSRGAYVLTIVFLVLILLEKVKYIKKRQRRILLLVICVILAVAFVFLYKRLALTSTNYMYRVQGLLNYVSYYSGDGFHMIFGNAEMAYDQEQSYVMTIRSTVGMSGSMEFAWLDILVKNGILGITGYIIIFARTFKNASVSKDWGNKFALVAVTGTVLVSSLVETYIQSIHAVFGIYSYLVMAAVCYMIKTKGVKSE